MKRAHEILFICIVAQGGCFCNRFNDDLQNGEEKTKTGLKDETKAEQKKGERRDFMLIRCRKCARGQKMRGTGLQITAIADIINQ